MFYKCKHCLDKFLFVEDYVKHVEGCKRQPKLKIEMPTIEPNKEKHEFPITKQAIKTIERVMDEQDEYGIKKYDTPLDWRDNYNWREMKLQELADFLKYEECEHQEKQEVIRILQSAVTLKHAENIKAYVNIALKLLTKTNTGK